MLVRLRTLVLVIPMMLTDAWILEAFAPPAGHVDGLRAHATMRS